jgi:peptidoglycan/LPS O-acetylase OafA/YrhL
MCPLSLPANLRAAVLLKLLPAFIRLLRRILQSKRITSIAIPGKGSHMDSNLNSPSTFNIGRIHYLDQVRALAMMIGILVHACYPYTYAVQANWTLTDKTSSLGITLGFFFVHIFRMTVFFFIAGFFANYLTQKMGVKGFIKNRMKRIALPFIIFWPLALIGVGGLQVFAIFYLPQESLSKPLRQTAEVVKASIAQAMAQKSGTATKPKKDLPSSNTTAAQEAHSGDVAAAGGRQSEAAPTSPSAPNAAALRKGQTNQSAPVITIHFWFLFNLIWFCLLAALLQKANSPFLDKLWSRFFSSSLYLWFLPLLLVPAIYYVGVPTPPAAHIIPQPWSFGYYGIFFLLGWQFFRHQDYLDRIEKRLGIFVLFSLVASIVYLYFSPVTRAYRNGVSSEAAIAFIGASQPSEKMMMVLLVAYLSVFLTIVSLLLGKRFLNQDNKFMRFISDSSYWIYIIHYPLVTFIQVFLATLAISGYIKFLMSSAMMLGIGLLTYRYLVRYTFIGTMLNGKKIKPRKDKSAVPVPVVN